LRAKRGNLKTCSIEALASTGKRLVSRLLLYGFLNATTYATHTITPATTAATTDDAKRSQDISGINALNAAVTSAATNQPTDNPRKIIPRKRARLPSLALAFFLSRAEPSIHSVLPWTIRARPTPNIVNVMPNNWKNAFVSMFITSFVRDYSTLVRSMYGEFKRGAAPLRALSSLSLACPERSRRDGRGLG